MAFSSGKTQWNLGRSLSLAPAVKEPSVHHPALSTHIDCAIDIATPATGTPEIACTAEPLNDNLQCYIDWTRSLKIVAATMENSRAPRAWTPTMDRNLPSNLCETRKGSSRLMEGKVRSPPVDKVTCYHCLGKTHRNATGVCNTLRALWTGWGMNKINRTKPSTYIPSNATLPSLARTAS
jgi:hypothetical protein